LKAVALPVPETIATDVLGVVNPNLGEEKAVEGSGMVPFERALVISYRFSQ